MANLNQHLTSGKADIALIQEPWASIDRVYGLGGTPGTVFTGTRGITPRTSIYVSKHISAISLSKFNNQDLTSVCVELWVGGEEKIYYSRFRLSSIRPKTTSTTRGDSKPGEILQRYEATSDNGMRCQLA